jgi:hypothetical protein
MGETGASKLRRKGEDKMKQKTKKYNKVPFLAIYTNELVPERNWDQTTGCPLLPIARKSGNALLLYLIIKYLYREYRNKYPEKTKWYKIANRSLARLMGGADDKIPYQRITEWLNMLAEYNLIRLSKSNRYYVKNDPGSNKKIPQRGMSAFIVLSAGKSNGGKPDEQDNAEMLGEANTKDVPIINEDVPITSEEAMSEPEPEPEPVLETETPIVSYFDRSELPKEKQPAWLEVPWGGRITNQNNRGGLLSVPEILHHPIAHQLFEIRYDAETGHYDGLITLDEVKDKFAARLKVPRSQYLEIEWNLLVNTHLLEAKRGTDYLNISVPDIQVC